MPRSLVPAGLAVLLLAAPGLAADPAFDARAAFAQLKGLAGTWTSEAGAPGHGHGERAVIYRVSAAGSAVVETQFPDTDHEMISVYHLDGDSLLMTHYCAAGNQPRLKLDLAASKPGDLVFAFDGGTNLDPAKDLHVHSARLILKDQHHLREEWTAHVDGAPLDPATTFDLTRP